MHLRKAGCTEAKPRGQEIPRTNHEFTDPAFTILDCYDDRDSDDLQFARGLIPQECKATVIRRPRFRSREIVDDDDLTFQQICRSKMWSLARFRVATVQLPPSFGCAEEVPANRPARLPAEGRAMPVTLPVDFRIEQKMRKDVCRCQPPPTANRDRSYSRDPH